MTSKTFVSGTVIDSAWLNDVDAGVYEKLGEVSTISPFAATLLDDNSQGQAQATLGIQSIGVGQYWTSQNGYRSLATTYTNNTGKPIFVRVSVLCNSGPQRLYFLIDGAGASWNTVVSGAYGSTSFIVPNGHTYRVEATNCTIDNWFELTA